LGHSRPHLFLLALSHGDDLRQGTAAYYLYADMLTQFEEGLRLINVDSEDGRCYGLPALAIVTRADDRNRLLK